MDSMSLPDQSSDFTEGQSPQGTKKVEGHCNPIGWI